MPTAETALPALSAPLSKVDFLDDYRLAWESRLASLAGRKEVFMGKAKFGIFGDGKEVPQLAMARAFQNGDFRAGYYRDQTFMVAIGQLTWQQYFAQLYANPDVEAEPATGGRAMNGHFATRMLDDDGNLTDLTKTKNSSADVSPTASQMPRLLGMAYASKLFRQNPELHQFTALSNKGNEVAFGTIGNASTSEGMFFEALNAAGVLQVPMLVSVWDDHYGISVPAEYQTTKQSISEIMAGLQRDGEGQQGFEIYAVRGWDYAGLIDTYQRAAAVCREQHVPVLIHVTELTQPQGHSTSGSHERYKSKERLQWEEAHDCLHKLREWLLAEGHATEIELDEIEKAAAVTIKTARTTAWADFFDAIKAERDEAVVLLDQLVADTGTENTLHEMVEQAQGEPHADSGRHCADHAPRPAPRAQRKAQLWPPQRAAPPRAACSPKTPTAITPTCSAKASSLLATSKKCPPPSRPTPRWWTPARCCRPASMPTSSATPASSPSAKTWARLAM
ncbi:thiamine pyrophosphate-dependent enzyme [Hymenobacter humi]|uniref:2-oxoisovalerate dehydrogenase subunit alpha n=1 Tax=Hymenobacter humi TaxID=1411620 RepID=A0ABW2UAR5_9BACT